MGYMAIVRTRSANDTDATEVFNREIKGCMNPQHYDYGELHPYNTQEEYMASDVTRGTNLESGDGTGCSIADAIARNENGICAFLNCGKPIQPDAVQHGLFQKLCPDCEKAVGSPAINSVSTLVRAFDIPGAIRDEIDNEIIGDLRSKNYSGRDSSKLVDR